MRALKNALAQKRLAEQVAAYNAQTHADLDMARSLQQSLLPDAYPCFPRSASPDESALRFCHRFFPATELAGDFFSVLALSDTQAGVFICDVMGHGVRSALVTAMVRALLDDLAPRLPHPGQFLSEMNRRLAQHAPAAGRTPVRHGVLSHRRHCHRPDALRQRRAPSAAAPATRDRPGRPARPAQTTGPALGLFPDAAYARSSSRWHPGILSCCSPMACSK